MNTIWFMQVINRNKIILWGGINIKTIELIINNELGLHARPASLFVKEANKYCSDIIIGKGNKEINAKSLIGILSLGISKGSKIFIKANGEDEDSALNALKFLVHSNFFE